MENNLNKYLIANDKDFFEEFRKNIIKSRELKNISQEQASKILNISQNIIINLENGDLKKISYNIFTQGHIRTYLKWLRLDHSIFFNNITVNNIKTKTAKNKSNIELFFIFFQFIAFPITNILREKYGKTITILSTTIISITTSIIIVFIWQKHSTKKIENYDFKDNYYNEKIKNNNIDLNNKNYVNDPKNIKTDTNKNGTVDNIKFIKILAKNESWIEIQNNNSKIIISKFLKKNENISIKYEKGLKLVTENAGGINIKINDITIKNIGKKGEVKRNISLDYANLLKFNE